jgi:hypothetical protein
MSEFLGSLSALRVMLVASRGHCRRVTCPVTPTRDDGEWVLDVAVHNGNQLRATT